jgi:hypothetical protein
MDSLQTELLNLDCDISLTALHVSKIRLLSYSARGFGAWYRGLVDPPITKLIHYIGPDYTHLQSIFIM